METARLDTDEQDRVRENTAQSVNRELDAEALDHVTAYAFASHAEIDARIRELRGEWDVERWLEANAGLIMLLSLGLARFQSWRWLALSAIVPSFLVQHAVQGWCPPIEIFRRLGARTRKEIDREIVALKALRGDFARVNGVAQPDGTPGQLARAAWEAAQV